MNPSQDSRVTVSRNILRDAESTDYAGAHREDLLHIVQRLESGLEMALRYADEQAPATRDASNEAYAALKLATGPEVDNALGRLTVKAPRALTDALAGAREEETAQ